jgi:Zn-dependent metalloprotease
MKKILLALLLILVVGFLKAQFLQGPAASRVVYGAEAVLVSERTGHVQYIRFGDAAPSSLSQLLEKRKPWMPAYNGAVTFRDKMSFRDVLGITHTRKQMLVNGLPIEGGIIITHERAGKLEALNGDLYHIKCPTTPVLGEGQALHKALAHVGAERYLWERGGMGHRFDQEVVASLPVGELVYAPRKGEYRDDNFVLAWKFDIYATQPLSRAWIFVDAQTGEVVYSLDRIQTADIVGIANTMYSGSMPITADQTGPGAYRLRETGRGGGIITRNCQTGTDYMTAVDFTDTDNLWNNVNAALDHCATDAHIGTEATYDYYNLVHNWHSYDNLNAPLLSFVHYGAQFGNAFWDGTQMTYGDGDGGTFSGPLTTFDVCGHEITHGVTEYTATLVYANEPGALNESFSDCFGKALEHRMTPSAFSWLVGKQCTVNQVGIRDMQDPTVFQNPGCYNGQYWVPGADVHYNSGVQNHWFYIMVEGDAGVNDLGNSYNVTALGWTKTEAIAFRNLSVYLTPNSEYADARFYAIQSASDLYGACSNEMIETANAWYAVGVGGPWTNTPAAAFVALPHNFCNAPATVNFVNNSNSGASFMWYFGDGGTSTVANPTHTYTALGNYTVKLVVTGCTGQKDSLIQTNYVVLDTNIACTVTLPSNGNTLINYCVGSIEDPGGPGNYPDNAISTVTITPPLADYLVLTFNSFSLEDFFDYLTIYDGPTTASPLIGSFTGQTLPNGGSITTTTGSVTMVFSSDASVTMAGFDMGFECFVATTAPTANFAPSATFTCDGAVSFSDMSIDHPNSWNWTFGDGGTSTLQSPMHVYTTPGTYTVTLQACNGVGCNTYTCTNCITFDPNSPNCQISTLPVAGTLNLLQCGGVLMDDGGIGPYSDNVESVAIINPPGATQVQLAFSMFDLEVFWDSVIVYDGASTSAPVLGGFTGNTIPNGGLPFVSSGGALTLRFHSDGSVALAGFEATWSATGATNGPNAQFTAPVSGAIAQVLNFTDQSTNAISWAWDFGDGNTAAVQNPTHAYSANGVYNVSLRVANPNGCDDYYYQNVYIGVVSAAAPTNMSLDIWPNPANDQVHLNLRLPATTDMQLKVMSALGQVVYAESLQGIDGMNRVLDLSKLSKGLYFVKIETPQGQLVRKLVMH